MDFISLTIKPGDLVESRLDTALHAQLWGIIHFPCEAHHALKIKSTWLVLCVGLPRREIKSSQSASHRSSSWLPAIPRLCIVGISARRKEKRRERPQKSSRSRSRCSEEGSWGVIRRNTMERMAEAVHGGGLQSRDKIGRSSCLLGACSLLHPHHCLQFNCNELHLRQSALLGISLRCNSVWSVRLQWGHGWLVGAW